jgi:hypothetical protein
MVRGAKKRGSLSFTSYVIKAPDEITHTVENE